MLTPEQRAQYGRDGYLLIPGFKPRDEIARLRERAGVAIPQGVRQLDFKANDVKRQQYMPLAKCG